MSDIIEPNDSDVLLGRGNGTATRPGNINFRNIIWEHRQEYCEAGRFDKVFVATKVLKAVASLDPPGRFMKMKESGTYYVVDDERALEKICQALREKTMTGPPKVNAIKLDDCLEDFPIEDQKTRIARRKRRKQPLRIKSRKTKSVMKTRTKKSGVSIGGVQGNETEVATKILIESSHSISTRITPTGGGSKARTCAEKKYNVPAKDTSNEPGRTMQLVSPIATHPAVALNRELIAELRTSVPDDFLLNYENFRSYEKTKYRRNKVATRSTSYRTQERSLGESCPTFDDARMRRNDDDGFVVDGLDKDDAAGTLLNFDEYDFTFCNEHIVQSIVAMPYVPNKPISCVAHHPTRIPVGMMTHHPIYPIKQPRFQKGSTTESAVCAPARRFIQHQHNSYFTSDMTERYERNAIHPSIARPYPTCNARVITPTQELYDDFSDSSTVMSSEELFTGCLSRIEPNMLENHPYTMPSLVEARIPGQYENVFDGENVALPDDDVDAFFTDDDWNPIPTGL
jgi:hypothetical protein